MALLKLLFTDDEGNETETRQVVSDEMGMKILAMVEISLMRQVRTKPVNVQDLTQTPKNKFTDGIGG